MDMQVFGQRVRTVREASGLSQAELAGLIGLGRTSVTNIERGIQRPPLPVLVRLGKALGVSTDQLLGEVELDPQPAVQLVVLPRWEARCRWCGPMDTYNDRAAALRGRRIHMEYCEREMVDDG